MFEKDIENQLYTKYGNSLLVVGNEVEGIDMTTIEAVSNVMACYGAQSIYFNRGYEPSMVQEENQLKQACKQNGWVYEGFNAQLLKEPDEVNINLIIQFSKSIFGILITFYVCLQLCLKAFKL